MAANASVAEKVASSRLGVSPIFLGLAGFSLVYSISAGANKAQEYHLSRTAGAIGGLASWAASQYLWLRMFGTSFFKGMILGGFSDDIVIGPLALMTFKRQWLYETRGFRQRHYRATIAPWSYTEEPTERATEAMRRGMAAIRGYQSFFGNEAAVMAARYAR